MPLARNRVLLTICIVTLLILTLPAHTPAQANQPTKLDEIGSQRYAAGDLDGAIAAFRQSINGNPNDALAYSNMGLALMDKGKLPEAAIALEQAINLMDARATLKPAPQNAKPQGFTVLGIALNNLAIVRYQQGQLDAALAAANRSIKSAAAYPDAWVTRGVILQNQGKLDEAIVSFRQAEVLNPKMATMSQNLGQALQKKGQLDEALKVLQQGAINHPDDPDLLAAYANALSQKGRLPEAVAAFKASLAIRPDSADALYGVGNDQHFLGNFPEALTALQQSHALVPTDINTTLSLAALLSDMGP